MKRRLGSILLTLAMLLALVPAGVVPVWAAVSGNGTEEDPYLISSWGDLVGALTSTSPTPAKPSGESAENPTYFKLTSGCTRAISLSGGSGTTPSMKNTYLEVASGRHVVLDLNGKTINRNISGDSDATDTGYVLKVEGTLTLKNTGGSANGIIGGGNNNGTYGGGVYVSGGTFIMEGGSICANKCSGSSSSGGGVYVASGGQFNMNGGTIGSTSTTYRNTAAKDGGGVYVASGGTFTMNGGAIAANTATSGNGGGVCVASGGTFTMNGGTISNNTATSGDGGGVYADGTFNVSGSADITGNKKGTSESAADYINNVYLPSGKKIAVSGNLSDARISVRPADTSAAFTSGLSGKGDASHFASDDMNYAAKLDGSEAKLAAAYPVWVGGTQVTPENKDDVLSDGKVSYAPASGDTPATLTLNGATITTAYDYIYPSGSYVYIYTAGIFSAEKLKINVTDDSAITGVDTTEARNGSYGIYTRADLEMTVDEGKTLTVAGGSTAAGSTNSYGIYVYAGFSQGSFTFSGPGTLNASGGASATWSNYGIFASGAATISGGTVNATGHTGGSTSGGVRAESDGVTITGGSLTAVSDDPSNTEYKNYGINCGVTISDGSSLVARGNSQAISGQVKNTIAGTGWTTTDGTGTSTMIAVSDTGHSISSYKKVQFPAVTVSVTGVTLNKASTSLTVGGTETLTATVAPDNATNKTVAWSSSNTSVATVANGVVTAVAAGTATITVTTEDGSKAATCAVTVTASGGDSSPSDSDSLSGGSGGSSSSAPSAVTTRNADGSTSRTVTNRDGSTTTTTTGADGSTSVATSKTDTARNADGSTTATTTETATATAADGTKIEMKFETVETLDASGSGTVTGTATETVRDASGNVTATTVTETTGAVATDAEGNKTTTTTSTATTTNADGSETVTVTAEKAVEKADGSTGKTVSDEAGNTISAEATVSVRAVEDAAKAGEAVTLPVEIVAGRDAGNAPAVAVTLPTLADGETIRVAIPVVEVTPSTIPVIVSADGGREIVKFSTASGDSVVLALDGDATVEILDNEVPLADVSAAAWYGDAVAWAAARGIMSGTGDGEFSPNASTTRGMMAQAIYNLDNALASGRDVFFDVYSGDWYYDSVTWAADHGVILGYEDETFRPKQNVTREEFAAMLYRYAGVTLGGAGYGDFADANSVSAWASDAVRWAVGQGILRGSEDAAGRMVLAPHDNATRAEIAVMIQRLCENIIK